MNATPEDVTGKKKAELTIEAIAGGGSGARGWEQGLSLTSPDGLLKPVVDALPVLFYAG